MPAVAVPPETPLPSLEIVLHDRPRRPVFAIRHQEDIARITVAQLKEALAHNLAVFSVVAALVELRTNEGRILSDSTTVHELVSTPPLFRPSPQRRPQEVEEASTTQRSIVLRALERDAVIAAAVLVDQQQMVFVDGLRGSNLVEHVTFRLQRVLNLPAAPRLFDTSGQEELDGRLDLNSLRCRRRKDDVLSTARGPSSGDTTTFATTLHLSCKLRDNLSSKWPTRSSSFLVDKEQQQAAMASRQSSPAPRTPSRSVVVALDAAPHLVQVFKTFDDWERPVSIAQSLPEQQQQQQQAGPTRRSPPKVVPPSRSVAGACYTEPRQVAVPDRELEASIVVEKFSTSQPPPPSQMATVADATGVEAPSWSDISVRGMPPSGYSSAEEQTVNSSVPRKLWGRIIHTVQPSPAATLPATGRATATPNSRFVNPASRLAPDMILREGQSQRGSSVLREDDPQDMRSTSNASSAVTQYRVGSLLESNQPAVARRSDGATGSRRQRTVEFDDVFIVGTPPTGRRNAR